MRLYRVEGEGNFTEYAKHEFSEQHFEQTLEEWLEANPEAILDAEPVLLIGRQVCTNLGTYIDLLGVAADGDVVVIELKRDETPRTTLAQALEYASFAADLDYDELERVFRTYLRDDAAQLAEAHREYFGLADEQAVAFNKRQRIVIVGHAVTAHIRQTADFLRRWNLPVTCLEFDYFKTDAGEELISTEIVVGKEPLGGPTTVSSPSSGQMSTERMLTEAGFARPALEAVFGLAGQDGLYLYAATKAISVNVDVGDSRVPLLYAYPPDVWFGKGRFTLCTDYWRLKDLIQDAESATTELVSLLETDPLWQTAGKDWKCPIDHQFSEQEIERIIGYVRDAREVVVNHGPKQPATEDEGDEVA